MKQSGWSFGWSMYGTPFYHGAKFGQLGLPAKSKSHILNLRIKTKKSLHISTSQRFFGLHQKHPLKKTHQNHSLMRQPKRGGPSFTGDLPLAYGRGTTCCRLCILGNPSKPKTWVVKRLVLEVFIQGVSTEKFLGCLVSPPAEKRPRSQNVFSKNFLASKNFEVFFCLLLVFLFGGGDAFWERIKMDISPQLLWLNMGEGDKPSWT